MPKAKKKTARKVTKKSPPKNKRTGAKSPVRKKKRVKGKKQKSQFSAVEFVEVELIGNADDAADVEVPNDEDLEVILLPEYGGSE
jgi:hypothetical protein